MLKVAIETRNSVIILFNISGERMKISFPKFSAPFTGTGDLFSALLLGWSKEGLKVFLRYPVLSSLHGTQCFIFEIRCPSLFRLLVKKPFVPCMLCYRELYKELQVSVVITSIHLSLLFVTYRAVKRSWTFSFRNRIKISAE